MLFQVIKYCCERCEILHYTVELHVKVLCGVTCQWLNLKSLSGSFKGALSKLKQVLMVGEVFYTYSFLDL